MSTIKLRRKAAPNAYFERKGSKLTSLEADQNLIEMYNLIAGISGFSTGDIMPSFALSKTGWVIAQGGTIGSASSGATARANADTATLFALIWDNTLNANYAILDSSGSASTRGASATADFAANKRLPLPDARGRVIIGAGTGSGLTLRTLFLSYGAETDNVDHTHAHTLSAASDGAHTHSISGNTGAALTGISIADHSSGVSLDSSVRTTATSITHNVTDPGHFHSVSLTSGSSGAHTHTLSGAITATSSLAADIIQPSLTANMFIKL